MEEAEVFLQLIRLGWGKEHAAFRQVFTSLFIPEATTEQAHWFNELQRVSSTPENAARLLNAFYDLDVREQAAALKVATLVLHAEGDLRIPFDEGRRLAALISDSRFVVLQSRNHILLKTEPAWQRFLNEVRSFLGVGPAEQHATIASGATVVVTITVKATDQKPIINKASVEAASPADPNLNNNTDTKTTNVGPSDPSDDGGALALPSRHSPNCDPEQSRTTAVSSKNDTAISEKIKYLK